MTVDVDWSQKTEYTFKRKGRIIPKPVYWYIAETEELDVQLSHEHTNYLWLQFDEAENMITFQQEKELLRSARNHLQRKGRLL